jgi:hypothetical protein
VLRQAGRCIWLFVSLTAMLFLYPLFDDAPLLGMLSTSATLVCSVWAFADDPRLLSRLGFLALVTSLLAGWAMRFRSWSVGVAALGGIIVFYGALLVIVLRFAVSGRVTAEKLVSVASGYMVAGFLWASMYRLVELLAPSSFGSVPLTRPDLLYFSFITLATIGYGDVTPHAGPARSLAILEGIFGIFYVAVLVSRLVNLSEVSGEVEDED